MTGGFVSLRRIAALSVAITLFAAPIASAQSPEAAPPSAASPNTALLSSAAFARLVQRPPAEVVPAAVVKAPRLDLLYYGTTATASLAQAAPAKAPQQMSWVSRHKWALIVWSVIGAVSFHFVHHCFDLGKCGDW
jgi:hypothetical protein